MNQAMLEQTGKLVSIQEAEEVLGVGRSTVYKLLDDGSLRSVKIGSARRIWTKDIEAFMANLISDSDQIVKDINELAYEGAIKDLEIDNPLNPEQ